MTRAIPAPAQRAAFVDARGFLTREAVLFLDALRGAVGGDAAQVTPNDAVGALAPVGVCVAAGDVLDPVAVTTAGGDLAPVASWSTT